MAALNTQRLTLKVCIVGAGPAGLAVARAFRAFGIAYEQFERHLDVGGIWDIENPGSPMSRAGAATGLLGGFSRLDMIALLGEG